MLMFGRNQHNSVKQLSFNLKIKKNFKKTSVAVYISKGELPNHYSDGTISKLHQQCCRETDSLVRNSRTGLV